MKTICDLLVAGLVSVFLVASTRSEPSGETAHQQVPPVRERAATPQEGTLNTVIGTSLY